MIYLVAVFLNRDEHEEKVTKTNLRRRMICFETRAVLPWPCIDFISEGVPYFLLSQNEDIVHHFCAISIYYIILVTCQLIIPLLCVHEQGFNQRRILAVPWLILPS